MEENTYIRRMDEHGKISIPIPVRGIMKIKENSVLAIHEEEYGFSLQQPEKQSAAEHIKTDRDCCFKIPRAIQKSLHLEDGSAFAICVQNEHIMYISKEKK